VVTGGAAALLLGCGQSMKGTGSAGGEGGSDLTGGSGGTVGGTGGRMGTGGAGTGGSPGTGGAGTGGAGTGGAGTGGMDATGGAGGGGAGGSGGMAGPDGGMPGPDGGGTQLACTKRNEQIVGPFPAANVQLNRSDIRSDPANGNAVKPGVPLTVVIKVGTKMGPLCMPLKGAVVNLWQCDATGNYSAYSDFGTAANQFLRGYQATDGSGVVEFQTIYPGSYAGRCVHVHFSVRMSASVNFPSGGFVGQMYFPDNVTDQVLTISPYKAAGRTRNAQDGFYAKDMLADVTRMSNGWLAELELGV
jgi:protocatechuate 3,4-dioxygenase beta subunit